MNFYGLRVAINESVSTRIDCDTHEFFGGISESFNEFNSMISESTLAIDTDVRVGNEILVEAVTMGASEEHCDLINEGVVKNVIARIKQFFRNILEYIKGIINKIKTYAQGMTKNTDKWYKQMKEAVETAAKNRDITKGFEWEGFEWNDSEAEGILDKAKAVAGKFISVGHVSQEKTVSIDTIDKYLKDITGSFKDSVKELNVKGEVGNVSSDNADEYEKTSSEKTKKALENYKESVKKAMGISGKVDNYKEEISAKVRGSKAAKSLKGIDSKYSKMLQYIKESSDKLSSVSDAYDDIKDKYEKALSAIEDSGLEDVEYVDGIGDKERKILETNRAVFTENLNSVKSAIGYGQGVYNSLCSLQLSLVQERSREYMRTLNRLANAKPKKA